MVDYISNTQDVRELARGVLPSDFPDAEIQEEQRAAYNYISIYTHKFDWSTSDPEYFAIQKLEEQLAKCYILEHYGGPKQIEYGRTMQSYIDDALDKVVENLVTPTTDDELLITSTDYKSWNLNADEPFKTKLSPTLRNLDSSVPESQLD